MDFFVSIGDIQDQIDLYHETHEDAPDLPVILRELYEQKRYISSETNLPDLSDFDMLNDASFLKEIRNLYFRFPMKILTNVENFDVVPTDADLTVISQFRNIRDFIHAHDCFEIDYIFKGDCEFIFLDEKRILKEGDFCIISPFTNHTLRLLDRDSQIFSVLVKAQTFSRTFFTLLSNDDILSDFFRKILSDSEEPNYLLFRTNTSADVRFLMKKLFLENFRYDSYVNQSSIHWLHLVFVSVLRHYETCSQFSSYSSGHDYTPILRYIQNHYTTVSLSELSKAFHYSVPYLSKIIKDITGQSFSALVRKLKMRTAVELLIKTNHSIEKIAEETGYSSSDHFYRVFKAYYGISPVKYRKRNSDPVTSLPLK